MKNRCSNVDCKSFENYGGRGIRYCSRWKHFANFAEDVGVPPFPGATIDRPDNNAGYGPHNFRWATRTEQCHNRRLFKNNQTGFTGVVPHKNGTFDARFNSHGVRYNLGRFVTREEAKQYRAEFISALEKDPSAAAEMCERRARLDSRSGIRGITVGPSGFIVRKTVKGKRLYLGHATSLIKAINILRDASHE